MPTYEYKAADAAASCAFCQNGFEQVQRMVEAPLTACPQCGKPVRKCFSAPRINGPGQSNFDQRAKSAGFHKLKRVGKGEYEKKY